MVTVMRPESIKKEYCNSQDFKCNYLQFSYGENDFCLFFKKCVEQRKPGSPINNRLKICDIDPMKKPVLYHPGL
jgi:hypothetical protein